MKQLELFQIESLQERPDNRSSFKCGKKRANRGYIRRHTPLMNQLNPEVKKVPLIVCKQPKTIKMIPYNWSKKKKEEYIKSHYDDNGRFIMNPAGDFDVFGGLQTRQ